MHVHAKYVLGCIYGSEANARRTGEGRAVTIPSQIAQLHSVNKGDFLEFTPAEGR